MKLVLDLLGAPDADTLERASNAACYFIGLGGQRRRHMPMLIGQPECAPRWAVYRTPAGAIVVRELEKKTNG